MFRFRDSKQPSWWKSLYVTFEIISLMLVTSGVETVPLSDFFPFNTSAGDRLTDTSDDGGSGEIKIKTLFPFFNRSYDKIYVNNNGTITFLAELKTYRPEYFPLDTDTPVIAPFWADVDVQVSGHVWYRQSTFAETLAKASAEIRTYFPALEKFVATWALIVTWDNVGFHGASEQGAHMTNTFQAVLVTDRLHSFVILNYNKIQWTTGSNSGGERTSGLGGNPAQVGFNAGDKKTFEEIPGARKDAVRNITLTSNVNVPGKWVFQVNIVSINEGSATNGENYVLALMKSNRLEALFDQTQGWLQLQFNSHEAVRSNRRVNFSTNQTFSVTSGIENKTFYVQTNYKGANIFSYNDYIQFSPLPISVLGTKYIVSSCHPTGPYTSLLVIATHSKKTIIHITFRLQGSITYDGKIYSDGNTLTMSLDYNQTFTKQSISDLSGSVINTTETVAVFSGTIYHDASGVNQTVAYDQLLPVRHHGQEYIVAVDNNPTLYQIQIVSEHDDTQIMFNNRSTVSVGDSTVYRSYLGLNDSLSFTTTKPVMTTLCRGAVLKSGFLVVPPTHSYRQRSGVYLHANQTFKILTDQNTVDVQVRTIPYSNFMVEWQDIPGTRFQVGTYLSGGSSSYYLNSENGNFTVLVYRPSYIFTGGYNMSHDRKVTHDNEDINIVGVVAAGTSTSLTTGMVFGGCIFFWRRMKRRNFEEEKTKEEAQTKKLFDPKQRPPHPPPGGAPPLARI